MVVVVCKSGNNKATTNQNWIEGRPDFPVASLLLLSSLIYSGMTWSPEERELIAASYALNEEPFRVRVNEEPLRVS